MEKSIQNSGMTISGCKFGHIPPNIKHINVDRGKQELSLIKCSFYVLQL